MCPHKEFFNGSIKFRFAFFFLDVNIFVDNTAFLFTIFLLGLFLCSFPFNIPQQLYQLQTWRVVHTELLYNGSVPSEFNGQICLVKALFIWNISIELTLKTFLNLSSGKIFLLLFWSCRLFSRIYAQSFLTTLKQTSTARKKSVILSSS